jgi:hypothetical protein
MLLNLPTALVAVRAYGRHYVKQEYFDGLFRKEDDVFSELEI